MSTRERAICRTFRSRSRSRPSNERSSSSCGRFLRARRSRTGRSPDGSGGPERAAPSGPRARESRWSSSSRATAWSRNRAASGITPPKGARKRSGGSSNAKAPVWHSRRKPHRAPEDRKSRTSVSRPRARSPADSDPRPSTLISASGATGGHEERSNSDRPPRDRSSVLVGRTPPEFRVPRGARTARLGRQGDRRRHPAPDTEDARELPQGRRGRGVEPRARRLDHRVPEGSRGLPRDERGVRGVLRRRTATGSCDRSRRLLLGMKVEIQGIAYVPGGESLQSSGRIRASMAKKKKSKKAAKKKAYYAGRKEKKAKK